MKQVLLSVSVGVLLVTGLVPSLTRAELNEQQAPIIVSEETFFQLNPQGCAVIDCEAFFGKLIVRAEHPDKMYWANWGEMGRLVNRYLPDGFYRSGDRYYYVVDGLKVRLYHDTRYKDLTKFLFKSYGSYQGINEATFRTLQENNDSELRTQLAGKIVMRVERNGELYYVPKNAQQDVLHLTPTTISIVPNVQAEKVAQNVIDKVIGRKYIKNHTMTQ